MSKQFVDSIMEAVVVRNAGEVEFHQAVQEVAESVASVIDKRPDIADHYRAWATSIEHRRQGPTEYSTNDS